MDLDTDAAAASQLSLLCLIPYAGLALLLTYWKAISISTHLLGLLILIPAIAAFFFGGLGFNMLTWGFIFMALCDNPAGMCCVCPCFFICAMVLFLALGLNSPVQRSWEIDALEPMRGVGMCSEEWGDFKGSIYFKDGALTQQGRMPKPLLINIARCYSEVNKGRPPTWYSCHFVLQPVFQCDVDSSYLDFEFSDACKPRGCAWAITADSSATPAAPAVPDCGRRHGQGLCGFATDLVMLMPLINEESKDTFHQALQDAAAQYPGNLTSASPLLSLVNPKEESASLRSWVPVYYLLLFLYVPFGAMSAFLLACQKQGCPKISIRPRRINLSDEPEWWSRSSSED